MVGFVDFALFKQVYYPVNSDNLTGWVNSFEQGSGEKQFLEAPEIIERSEQGRDKNPFSETIGKYDEIQLKIEEIREIWTQGYNYHTKELKEIEPLINGLVKLESFISDYWEYFVPDEKIRLVTQANLLKWYHESIRNLTFWKWLKFVFPKRIIVLLKLYFKYSKNIRQNPKSHVFLQLQNANLRLADLIINRAKEDFEKEQKSVRLEEYQALLKDYSSLEETAYLLSSPANAERLLRSIKQAKAGKGVRRELIE